MTRPICARCGYESLTIHRYAGVILCDACYEKAVEQEEDLCRRNGSETQTEQSS
jgi:hypothetical protein